MKKQKTSDILDIVEDADDIDEFNPEEKLTKNGFSVASMVSVNKYMQNGQQDMPEDLHRRSDSLIRPIKSAGDIKVSIENMGKMNPSPVSYLLH